MRQIYKQINLSKYKSYISGKMHAYKDNAVVDISELREQEKYNSVSNHSMLPITIIVDKILDEQGITDINYKPWHISWNTLHVLYMFFKNTDEDYIKCFSKTDDMSLCREIVMYVLSYVDFLNKNDIDVYSINDKQELKTILVSTTSVLGVPVNYYLNFDAFLKLKKCIIEFVEEGSVNGDKCNCNIQYLQDIENMNPCNETEIYSHFEIPLMITNSIDNLGQVTNLIENWQPNVDYSKKVNDFNFKSEPMVAYDDNDWVLNSPNNKGYTWLDCFKESIFGNLSFNKENKTYEYIKNQWKRNIQNFNEIIKKNNDIISAPTKIQGKVPSQISLFQNKTLFYDELGDSVDGDFIPIQNKITDYIGVLRPNQGDSLSLQFKVGTANNLTEINDMLYWGNLLHSITYQVKLPNGDIGDFDGIPNIPTGFQIKYIYDNYTIEYVGTDNQLKVIKINESQLEVPLSFKEALSCINCELLCVIKYNIGGFIKKKSNGTFTLADDLHHGIEYKDTFTISQETFLYNRSLTERYPIYYYTLSREDNMSEFSMEIPEQYQTISNDKFGLNSEDVKFDAYRGFIYSPTIMEDYNIGIASQEKVSGDIYIDRGISSTFEKHLKLQEISTMQDLENYSNGGFFTITNSTDNN